MLEKRCSASTSAEMNELMHEPDLFSLWGNGYWDDAKGGFLDPQLAKAARKEEMEYVHKRAVYKKVPVGQCWAETGKAPVKTGWAETNKGTTNEPNVRSRWVAKEYRNGVGPDLYAGTPPLEALKLILSSAATGDTANRMVAFIDVRRAYFYAPAKRKVYVELPEEDATPGMCGLLLVSLYGTRGAAQNLQN